MRTPPVSRIATERAARLETHRCRRSLKPDAKIGTCAAAAATGQPVMTPDFRADEKWADLRHLPIGLGSEGAWSLPIKDPAGRACRAGLLSASGAAFIGVAWPNTVRGRPATRHLSFPGGQCGQLRS